MNKSSRASSFPRGPKIGLPLMVALLLAGGAAVQAGKDWKQTGNAKATKLDQCVEPTEVMRRDHMEFLFHQRDETVLRGIRTTKHSLVECIGCHANKNEKDEFIAVNAPGQFCQSCHTFAGVSMDCFQCHATKPRKSAYFHPLVTPAMKKAGFHAQTTTMQELSADEQTMSALLGSGGS